MTTLDGAPDDFGSAYRLLSTAVTPRPIGWISTTSPAGVDNLAPYSFCNVVAVNPPVVMFAPVTREDGLKNTPRNVEASEEFVLNTVTRDLAAAMNTTSATLPPDESEFDHADIERAEKVAVECELYEWLEIGASTAILGEVVRAHVDDEILTDGKADITKLETIGRLAGSHYATTDDRFSLDRPP